MLSISDWISFLISEKNPNIGNAISFSAFILATLAVVMSVVSKTPIGAITFALFGVALIILVVLYFRTNRHFAEKAEELLNDIMSGNERDLLKIEERWRRVKEGQKNK